MRWDIFCRVIDNYGDIGVCWRLARQLANEHHQQVRLWVDDINSLTKIWPEALDTDHQICAGVEVRYWPAEFCGDIEIAEAIIEAFACDIPDSYITKMAAKRRAGNPPVWINLEYLSAEPWVEECHGMTSIQPSTGLLKTFFFPGFTRKTGGLLREKNLITDRENFDKQLLLKSIQIKQEESSLLISLFAYENLAVGSLLNAWSESSRPIHCLVPTGKILTSINSLLGKSVEVGKTLHLGSLTLDVVPFLTQAQYDRLLWACDLNFVRGEDSFVRAQWAGKPFVWHIYPQDEQAHMIKLNAFLDIFLPTSETSIAANLRVLWHEWNEQQDVNHSWSAALALLAPWEQLATEWQARLSCQADLASQLMALASKPVV